MFLGWAGHCSLKTRNTKTPTPLSQTFDCIRTTHRKQKSCLYLRPGRAVCLPLRRAAKSILCWSKGAGGTSFVLASCSLACAKFGFGDATQASRLLELPRRPREGCGSGSKTCQNHILHQHYLPPRPTAHPKQVHPRRSRTSAARGTRSSRHWTQRARSGRTSIAYVLPTLQFVLLTLVLFPTHSRLPEHAGEIQHAPARVLRPGRGLPALQRCKYSLLASEA